MEITITNIVRVSNTPGHLYSAIRKRLSFTNPKWLENDRMGRWNGNTPREFRCYETDGNGDLVMPRGFTGQLLGLCRKAGVEPNVIDRTRVFKPSKFNFHGELRPFQEEAIGDIMQRRHATLSAATGSGKTVMALAIIAERRQPALVVVHTRELLNQWIDRAGLFLGIPTNEIGIIGGGKKTIGARLTVATVQTLYKIANNVVPHIGHLIVDECHRCPSRTFTKAVTMFDCRYLLGLSATPWRRDKLSKLIFWYLGDVKHQVDKSELQNAGHILTPEIITRQTDFIPCCDPSRKYSAMLCELTDDNERNRLIAADVASQVGNGVVLVLSDRKNHCKTLQAILQEHHGIDATVLTGDTPVRQRQEIVKKINTGAVPVLVATGQLIGEGFDCKHLLTLFLATPIRFSGRLLQYVGRVLRPGPGKQTPRVYDYIDVRVGPLIAAARARQQVYRNAVLMIYLGN